MNSAAAQYLPLDYMLDQFRIEGVLGAGSFGVTYKAWDETLHTRVAIKEYFPADFARRDPETMDVIPVASQEQLYQDVLDKFLEEARFLARFKHPNICRINRYLEDHGTAYLIMDYEEGESLDDYLKSEARSLSEQECIDIIVPILKGLGRLHEERVLHRDVKPANIYLRKNGEPMLLDFGAARQLLQDANASMTVIVSRGYAAPEQYGGDHLEQGPWTDLYGIGATLYRCISNRAPVESVTRITSLHNQQPDPLNMENVAMAADARYSSRFRHAVNAMLSLIVDERPRNAEAAIALLTTGEMPAEAVAADDATVVLGARGGADATVISPPSGAAAPAPAAAAPAAAVSPAIGAADAAQAAAPQAMAEAPAKSNTPMIATAAALVVILGLAAYLWLGVDDTPEPQSQPVANTGSTPQNASPNAGAGSTSSLPPPQSQAAQNVPATNPQTEPARNNTPVRNEPSVAAAQPQAQPEPQPRYEEPAPATTNTAQAETGDSAPAAANTSPAVEPVAQPVLPKYVAKQLIRHSFNGQSAPAMIVVPEGRFMMGADNGDPDERPRREIAIPALFAISQHEITEDDFRLFERAQRRPERSVRSGDASAPVTGVSWADAAAYARWLSQNTGHVYRLPSEAEWEYAARAGSDSAYHVGASISSADANYAGGGLQTGGRYQANDFDLHDMHGNVWEWTADCYVDNYHQAGSSHRARQQPGCERRVLRGGGWNSDPSALRSSNRSPALAETRSHAVGFRLVLELGQ